MGRMKRKRHREKSRTAPKFGAPGLGKRVCHQQRQEVGRGRRSGEQVLGEWSVGVSRTGSEGPFGWQMGAPSGWPSIKASEASPSAYCQQARGGKVRTFSISHLQVQSPVAQGGGDPFGEGSREWMWLGHIDHHRGQSISGSGGTTSSRPPSLEVAQQAGSPPSLPRHIAP